MNNLEILNLIKKEKLNPGYYYPSLLQEAYRLNLLTDSEFEAIQLQNIQLLAKQTQRYTGGDSSSVRVEIAQSILQSIYYCVGVYLKGIPDADACVALLKEKPIFELYQHGKKLIASLVNTSNNLLIAIQKDCICTDNIAYIDTIRNGFLDFPLSYDVEYAAHVPPVSIDYPLSNDKMDLVGVEYIHYYLQKLSLENRFCKHFSSSNIQFLLYGYDEHYQDLLINIFSIVLTNSLGSLLANKDLRLLDLDTSDRNYLQQKLSKLPKENLILLFQDTSTLLCQELNITDQALQKHIIETATSLTTRLIDALENKRLELIFISFKVVHAQPPFLFEDGKKMDDELFRTITDQIRECRFVSDKIIIIQNYIHSIADLIDVLEGYCIFEHEFFEIFLSLGDMELALLMKELPEYIIDSDFHLTENEKEWHTGLNTFFEGIDLTRRENIRKLSEDINID